MIKNTSLFLIASLITFGAQAVLINVEPDAYSDGTIIEDAYTGVFLSVTDPLIATAPLRNVIAIDGHDMISGVLRATTGSLIFGFDPPLTSFIPPNHVIESGQYWDENENGLLRADFDIPTNYVQIDLIFDDLDIAELRAYSTSGLLLDTVHVEGDSIVTTSSITRSSSDIAYITVGGITDHGIFLDNMVFDSPVPVPAAVWLFGSGLIGLIGIARRKKS